ncbi:hypothetical protein [Bacillus paranthracis]|uniref:hypothetical protein n=1 Tax=Bacillus paranthracis TaxID=2026186 RepID=UPI0013D303B3|nr:hypothetical protein [Bacillus paranthracis]
MTINNWCVFNEGNWLTWNVNKENEIEVYITVENTHQGCVRLNREQALKLHGYLERKLREGEIN